MYIYENNENRVTIKGKVFNLRESKNSKDVLQCNLSTYSGKKKDGSPKFSSWNNTYFMGAAYWKAVASEINEGDLIEITHAIMTCSYQMLYARVDEYGDFVLCSEDDEGAKSIINPSGSPAGRTFVHINVKDFSLIEK